MPGIHRRNGSVLAIGFVLSVLVSACGDEAEAQPYLGTWDPVMLTPQGEVTVIPNGGISFREDEVCFIRFDEECYDASYAPLGDTTAVNMNGDPTYYLLHAPIDGYLVVREMSDRPILYIRRED